MKKTPPPINDGSCFIFVTGSSSGIGRECALTLSHSGYHVIAGVRNVGDLKVPINPESGTITPVILDVCDKNSIEAAFETVSNLVGEQGLSGLINNAGITVAGPLECLNLDRFRAQMDVNLFGLLSVSQTFIPLLRKGRGRIINMGSISGRVALPFLGSYSASKFAVRAITDSMRLELKPWNIGVTILEVGNVNTALRGKALDALKEDSAHLPQAVLDLYGKLFKISEDHSRRKGMDPLIVALSVKKVLAARNLKRKYTIGKDAKIIAIIDLLPLRIRDWIISKPLPKYGHDK